MKNRVKETRLDDASKDALDEWEVIQGIKLGISEGRLEAFLEAKENDLVEDIVNGLCKDKCTGDFRTNIIMAAYYANLLAHNEDVRFYSIKSYLLEYTFSNELWGEEPYDSFGIGTDDYDNEVAYFDVPNCGQVSFHLVDTYYGDETPDYLLKWCETPNLEFPTYDRIENLHNLLIALGYTDFDIDENPTQAMYPIDFSGIKNDEGINTCYFIDLNEFYRGYYECREEHYDYETQRYFYEKKFDISLFDKIKVKKILFSKKNGIISERDDLSREEIIDLFRRYQNYNYVIKEVLDELGLTNSKENSK